MSYELLSTFASLPHTQRGYPIVLNGDPKGKNFLYCNGTHVFIRELENPEKCDVYSEHAKQATLAKYSPSGFYIASGDITGKIRIWDTTQAEHILKYEYQPIGGAIKDIAWGPESKRIFVGGEGRGSFCKVFLWDSGSTIGDINSGHGKSVNSVDYKLTRPYRLISGSEDYTSVFYEGPPFKFKQTNKDHSNFVQTVRFSPNGELFATGSSDGKIVLYNGKDSSLVKELGEAEGKAHKGGVYAMSWSPDSTQLLSASGDKSCKIWNVSDFTCTVQFNLGNTVNDMQLGCLWQGDNDLISVSLSGAINYLDKENPVTPKQVLWGHNKMITAMALSEDGSTIYTACTEGRVVQWDVATGKTNLIGGKLHSNQVNAMTLVGDKVASIGYDDMLRFISIADKAYIESAAVGTNSQPKCITSGQDGLIVVGCIDQVNVYRNETKKSSLSVDFEAISVAVHPNQKDVAVGTKSSLVVIYELDGDNLTEKERISSFRDQINSLSYSQDGEMLAVGSGKVLAMVTTSDYKYLDGQDRVQHTASINKVSWSPDGKYVASCGLDTQIVIWSREKVNDKIKMLRAHPKANIHNIAWIDDATLVSSGADCCVKKWKITH